LADATYTTTTRVPLPTVWDFVQDMDNWGRFVTGYQKHEKQDDKNSTWTLKGDVGVLSRTLTFQVEIVEWNAPTKVAFTLKGVNEPMQGEGTFTLQSESNTDVKQDNTEAGSGDPSEDGLSGGRRTGPQTPPPRKGLVYRLLQGFWRWLLGRAEGAPIRDPNATTSAPGDTVTRLEFQLRLQPGGPMAPMIDAMIRPLLLPAAEHLANSILAELEQRRSAA
jgi:carbon monoxide dehydrogenase subunit G